MLSFDFSSLMRPIPPTFSSSPDWESEELVATFFLELELPWCLWLWCFFTISKIFRLLDATMGYGCAAFYTENGPDDLAGCSSFFPPFLFLDLTILKKNLSSSFIPLNFSCASSYINFNLYFWAWDRIYAALLVLTIVYTFCQLFPYLSSAINIFRYVFLKLYRSRWHHCIGVSTKLKTPLYVLNTYLLRTSNARF